jgi:hypothetical protein
LYSTAKREAELRSMHEVNHRELPIAKLAARVADFLWPNCQENIDQALADAKAASANMRVIVEEDVYVPPEVPHFLPFTSWYDRVSSQRPRYAMLPQVWLCTCP